MKHLVRTGWIPIAFMASCAPSGSPPGGSPSGAPSASSVSAPDRSPVGQGTGQAPSAGPSSPPSLLRSFGGPAEALAKEGAPSASPKATAPIRLEARVEGKAGPGVIVRLHAEAVPEIGTDSLEIHWILPEGWIVSSGKTVWEGRSEAGETHALDCEVVVPPSGGGDVLAKAVIKGPGGAVLSCVSPVAVGTSAAAPKPSPLRETTTPEGRKLLDAPGAPR